MTLLAANIGLFLTFALIAFFSSRQVDHRIRVWVGFVLAIVTLPAALYALYYLHLFDDWLWFYRVRSYQLSNFYPSTLGCFVGWLLPSLHRPVLRLTALAVAGALVIVPFAKPVLLPLDSTQLSDRWRGFVSIQSTPSTCGPASMTTVLAGGFGDKVSESDVARAAHSTSTGTEVWYLAQFLRARGYRVDYRHSERPLPYSIAGTRLGSAGHFVAVLDCRDNRCSVADPLSGIVSNGESVRFNGFYLQIRRANPL